LPEVIAASSWDS